MGKSAKLCSVRKANAGGKIDFAERVATNENFKKRARKPKKARVKNAIIARRLENPETLQDKSINSLMRKVQSTGTLSRGQKRRLSSKVRYLKHRKMEDKAK